MPTAKRRKCEVRCARNCYLFGYKNGGGPLSALARGAGALAASPGRAAAPAAAGLPADWRGRRKFDAHNHVFLAGRRGPDDWRDVDELIAAADALGIERLYCSRPITGGVMADLSVVRDANDSVLAAARRHPGRIFGYGFVQPGNGPAALDELRRCLDAGMVGVKLYNQFKYTDSAVFPVAEECIRQRVPLLGHSACLTDPRSLAAQPRTSHALDFGSLARRYPELILILGHLLGGGDWEWTIRALRECPGVRVDTSGSVNEAPAIERLVAAIGAERVLFATDATMECGVGRILSPELTEAPREDIFWRNFERLLARRSA